MILDGIIYETLLEAKAAEHAARMIAMKNAKDSANKKTSLLTLIYNKTRQAAITKEVSEIKWCRKYERYVIIMDYKL